MIVTATGDLLDVPVGIICHQVNCRGAFGAGIAAQIAGKWPVVERVYRSHLVRCADAGVRPLGTVSYCAVAPGLTVANLYAQLSYGNGAREGRCYTDYGALRSCLEKVRLEFGWDVPMHVPYRIGCGLAGGDWKAVRPILEEFGVTVVRRPCDM